MPSAYAAQIRVTGLRACVRVFAAFDVPMSLAKEDRRGSRYLTEEAKAIALFNRKHPGARITEVRFVKSKESDHPW